MRDESTFINKGEFVIELITENEANTEFKEASSAVVSKNPAVNWAKFILTDDLPNGNKQRIPKEEFPGLVRTGVYMPIKMAKGVIEQTHDGSFPIGVIANLKEEGNQIVGLAALWSRERPEDVELLKKLAEKNKPITLSWEILYRESTIVDGIEELHGTSLKASTIVGRPAYGDRTPILALAAKGSPAYLDSLPDESFLYIEEVAGIKVRQFPFTDKDGKTDQEILISSLEEIKTSSLQETLVSELVAKAEKLLEDKTENIENTPNTEDIKLDELETVKSELEQTKTSLTEAKLLLETKDTELTAKEVELSTLREFKASIETKAAEETKISRVQEKFASANITKPAEYFVEHREFLLGLSDDALDFLLQELVSFSDQKTTTASTKTEIPNLPGKTVVTSDIKAIVNELNSHFSKKHNGEK